MKKISKLFEIYIILFLGLVLFESINIAYYKKANILYIIPGIILFGLIYFFSLKIKDKYFAYILFLGTFISKIIVGLLIQTTPVSDFNLLFKAGKMFAAGDYSFKEFQYFSTWAYQSGFAVYQGIVMKLFGININTLKILNCLYIAITTLLVYKIGRILFNDFAGRVAGLIHATYITLLLYTPVLTNQHIATMFYYLGIYYIVKNKNNNYKNLIFAGLFFAIGNVFRPMAIVFLLAVFILAFLNIGVDFNKFKTLKSFKQFGACLIVYLVIFYSISNLLIVTGITDTGLKNNNPYWKFVAGLNEASSGRYSQEDIAKLNMYHAPLDENLLNKEKDLIIERLSIPPSRLGKLMIRKIKYMWGDYEFFYYSFPQLTGKNIIKYGFNFDIIIKNIKELEKMIYILIISICLYGLIKEYKEDKDKYLYYLYYSLTVYTGIHFFIEISSRYKYEMMGIIFILAGNGFRLLKNTIDNSRYGKLKTYKHR
ncbi:MAG: glycosyltransferase family 39 protein [Vallitalea sp.]|jgi:hypothetical protein|nr:glycosyltransferase family 39 protein [Vallitalea sp.]